MRHARENKLNSLIKSLDEEARGESSIGTWTTTSVSFHYKRIHGSAGWEGMYTTKEEAHQSRITGRSMLKQPILSIPFYPLEFSTGGSGLFAGCSEEPVGRSSGSGREAEGTDSVPLAKRVLKTCLANV